MDHTVPAAARTLLKGAEREIAEHGFSGAQLKRAAVRIDMNPASYNYYFAQHGQRAIDGVVMSIYSQALTQIDRHRMAIIEETDRFYKVKTYSINPRTQNIELNIDADKLPHTTMDLLRIATLPVLKYILDQGRESYFGTFGLMMFMEDPSLYFLAVKQMDLPGHAYNREIYPIVLKKVARQGRREIHPDDILHQVMMLQWQLIANFEDNYRRGNVIDVEPYEHIMRLLNALDRYMCPDPDPVDPLSRLALNRLGLLL